MSKYSIEIKQFEKIVSYEFLHALADAEAIVAGGTLTSIFSGKEVNDVDVYFRSHHHAIRFLDTLKDEGASYSIFHATDRSVLLRDHAGGVNGTGQDVQMIVYKFFKTPQEIFEAFDFSINMAAFTFHKDDDDGEPYINVVMVEDFLKDLAQRRLVFNPKTDYPLISDLRVDKYKDRGFSISRKEKFKILLAVNAKNIDSWEVLKDELGSMYGLNKDELFDETQEFSIENAMSQLDNIAWSENYNNLNHPTIREVKRIIQSNAGFKYDPRNGRYFKVVRKTSALNEFESVFRHAFKYTFSDSKEWVAGESNGIYFAEGTDGLERSCYWYYLVNNPSEYAILELEFPKSSRLIGRADTVSTRGEYRVIGVISYDEWVSGSFVE